MVDVMGYFDVLWRPQQLLPKELKKASMGEGAVRFIKAGAIAGVASGVLGLIITLITKPDTFIFAIIGGIFGIIFSAIFMAIIYFLAGGFGSFIDFLFAKLLGGKGTVEENIYLNSAYACPAAVLMAIVMFVFQLIFLTTNNVLPGLILFIIFGIYLFYVSVISSSIANRISAGRALVAKLIPTAIVIVLIIAFLGALIFSLLAATGGSFPGITG